MYILGVKIENFRGIGKETIFKFNPGITVLVGENDSGKSTVIDAIRYVVGTTDQNWYRVEISDYHNENTEDEIRISICFSDLSLKEKAAFMECLIASSLFPIPAVPVINTKSCSCNALPTAFSSSFLPIKLRLAEGSLLLSRISNK